MSLVMLLFVCISQYHQLKYWISSCLTHFRQHGQHNQLKLPQTRVVEEQKCGFFTSNVKENSHKIQ